MLFSGIIKRIKKCYRNIYNIETVVKTHIIVEKYKTLSLLETEMGVSNEALCDYPVIVSLTSYGKKIQEVCLAIESLMQQTVKPNKIVLCLSEDFKGKLPVIIQRQQKRGLEVLFCNDVRSYTKLVPTLNKYPRSVIVTADDDIIYPMDFLEYLLSAYKNNPSKIYFYYGHTILMDKEGNPAPYKQWMQSPAKGSSIFNLPTGVDGILYPPYCFHEDVCREEIFLDLCPYADDLWFKCMSLLKGVECECVERVEDVKSDFIHLDAADRYSLATINNGQNMNDLQFEKLFHKYNLGEYLR